MPNLIEYLKNNIELEMDMGYAHLSDQEKTASDKNRAILLRTGHVPALFKNELAVKKYTPSKTELFRAQSKFKTLVADYLKKAENSFNLFDGKPHDIVSIASSIHSIEKNMPPKESREVAYKVIAVCNRLKLGIVNPAIRTSRYGDAGIKASDENSYLRSIEAVKSATKNEPTQISFTCHKEHIVAKPGQEFDTFTKNFIATSNTIFKDPDSLKNIMNKYAPKKHLLFDKISKELYDPNNDDDRLKGERSKDIIAIKEIINSALNGRLKRFNPRGLEVKLLEPAKQESEVEVSLFLDKMSSSPVPEVIEKALRDRYSVDIHDNQKESPSKENNFGIRENMQVNIVLDGTPREILGALQKHRSMQR